MKNNLLIHSIIISVFALIFIHSVIAIAQVSSWDSWATEGGSYNDNKMWIYETNTITQPFVWINVTSVCNRYDCQPRVECWDFSGTHNGTTGFSGCRAASTQILTECRNNCYSNPSISQYDLNSVCSATGCFACVGSYATQTNSGYCVNWGNYYNTIHSYLDWRDVTNIYYPQFRVRYYYNCSPSVGDGTDCKESTGWTYSPSTIYMTHDKGIKCQGSSPTNKMLFNYILIDEFSNQVTYGPTGDCSDLSGTQSCDPDKTLITGNPLFQITNSNGAIPSPCNGDYGSPCLSNSQCIASFGLFCSGGYCDSTETPFNWSSLSPADHTAYPSSAGPLMYVYGTLSTGNRDADVLVKYIKNGGPVQTYTFSSKQLKNTVSSPYQLGLSVAPGDSYQWQYCANTEPYHGTGFSCSYLRSFTVANVINYTAPTVTLDLPTDGYTFGTGTTNVTLNFTVNAGTSATNHLVYFDGNEQPLCTYVTPANTSVAYNCTITITGGYSHNWYVNYYDDVYAGHTNTNTATRIFSINPPIIGSPASITIDSPTEYQKGTWNGTSTEWKFIPLINVNTYNESINLSFYVGSNLTYFNYYNTVQIPNTTINYSPGIYNAHCYGFLCNLQAHFVEGVTDTITYNTSRPFTIYANESYPYIKNNEPINQSTYAIGTTTIPFYGDSISCGDVECKNAYIYLIIDNEVPILVGTQNSTEIAKRWNYNKTGMTAGNHSYYWALDNTISGFGGTTISYDDRWNFIINASVAGWYPPDVNIISPPDGQTYTAGTTSVTLYANITTGSNATDTYFVFDGITYPKESGLIIPNTTREYLMVINVTTGTHTWTYWAEDYIANYTATSRTFTINASTTCTPDKGACTTNESCCSKLCSNGYCHYDTGFYEINIPVDDNGNPMLVSTDNPMCDPNISSNCGIIPQIYRGAFIIFAKIGHPMIILMSVVILCLFIIILGGFVIRVARGP